MTRVSLRRILPVALLVGLSFSGLSSTPHANAQVQIAAQPTAKRNVFVFLVQFLDVKNQSSPGQILDKLRLVNSYFSNVTYGAWQFNWDLIYPTLGQPWFTANETYAEAGVYNSAAKLPMAKVVTQAWNQTGPFPNISSDCCNDFSATNIFIIIHAGNDSAVTGNPNDIWSITAGPVYLTPRISYDLSFVAENDFVGMMIYEMTHQLEWFTENGQSFGQIGEGFPDPSWGLQLPGMAFTSPMDLMFGGGGYPNGPHPSDYGVFDRLTLGLPINISRIDHGQTQTIALSNIEEHSSNSQGILIPVKTQVLNGNPYSYFYILELRSGNVTGDGDSYFPWNTGLFPARTGLLIWYFNYSETGGGVHGYLVKAHSFDVNAETAMFGPCAQQCTNMTFHDSANNIDISILSTSASAYVVRVSNTANSLICPTPSVFCFLGFLDFGSWGILMNATLVLVPFFLLALVKMKRARADGSIMD